MRRREDRFDVSRIDPACGNYSLLPLSAGTMFYIERLLYFPSCIDVFYAITKDLILNPGTIVMKTVIKVVRRGSKPSQIAVGLKNESFF